MPQDATPTPAGRLASFLTSPTRRVIAVNVVLLTVLVSMTLGPGAGAQPAGQPGRARGDYTMLSGKPNTGSSHVVYVVDAANQELVALRWDSGRQKLTGVGYRNLDADAKSPPTR